jgi:hypothetical protein
MNNFVKLGSGQLINLDNVTHITPVEKRGMTVHFVTGEKIELSSDDTISFLTDLRNVAKIDIEESWMVAFLGKAAMEEWRNKKVRG